MTDPALELLRRPSRQELQSSLPPHEVLTLLQRTLEVATDLTSRVDGNSFRLAHKKTWRGTYPGHLEGVVQDAPPGSRVLYWRQVTPGVQLVLSVWAVISVALLLLSAGMAVASLLAGDYLSVAFSFWPGLIMVLVWMNWRRLARRGAELDRALTQLLEPPPGNK